MGTLKIYDTYIPRSQIVAEREAEYLSQPPEVKLKRLLALIRLSIAMNGGKPLKLPQGKGLVISQKK
jgi:hypothetical protein